MIHLLRTFAHRSRRVLSLFALCLSAALVTGAWTLIRFGGTPASAQEVHQGRRPVVRPARGRNLALQPTARGLDSRLGQRFLKAGREVSVSEGTLTTGAESRRVVVRRVQEEGGEQVEVRADGRGAPVIWDAVNGASQSGQPVDAETAAMAERIARDAPDQFVLAQLRGASYIVVARNVRADKGGEDGYSGPLHDIVRVSEPSRGEGEPSAWRLYYVNTETGLLDKVAYDESGERVEAVLSDWAEHAGELQPTRITWSRQGQVFMELALTNVTHGPQQ